MIEIIHTFFAGITFSVGVVIGALLCRMATEKGRKEIREETREINEKIHARLNASLACHERMADAMETMIELKRKDSYNVQREAPPRESTTNKGEK